MSVRSRHRRRLALVVVLCLLFQQMAMVAYACTLSRMPAEPVAMSQECAEMGMTRAADPPALCAKHCDPDASLIADPPASTVPPLALSPPSFSVVHAPSTRTTAFAAVPIERSDPPPRLRYCSLLI